ncbi:hypothetical protein [Bartonella sp. B30(2025)]
MIKSISLMWRMSFCTILLVIAGCLHDESTTSHIESSSLTQRSFVTKGDNSVNYPIGPAGSTRQQRVINNYTRSEENVKTFSREKDSSSSFSVKVKRDAHNVIGDILKQIENQ